MIKALWNQQWPTPEPVQSSIGGFAGLLIGAAGAQLLGISVPALPVHTPWSFVVAAEAIAVFIGLLAGCVTCQASGSFESS